MTAPVVKLAEIKRQKERKEYAALVLGAWDQLDHADKRQQLDRRAEVELAARERI